LIRAGNAKLCLSFENAGGRNPDVVIVLERDPNQVS
jgi:hypothetical protein